MIDGLRHLSGLRVAIEGGALYGDDETFYVFFGPLLLSGHKEHMDRQLSELLMEPGGEFENFTRMSLADFEYLLNIVSPMISKKDTSMRQAITPKIRLAITLRYLATGDSFKSLHYLFKVSSEEREALKDEIKMPSTTDEWIEIEKGFRDNFPHAIGAIDGKHVVIKCPDHTGSEYYNYKRTFSIVLLAVVDSKYRFIFCDIGSQGRISDGGILRNSVLWKNICENKMNFPPSCPLPGLNVDLPYVYPGDHKLNTPKRIFNETLSRSRVLSENTFGILTSRFRFFKKPIELMPEKVTQLTMTCVLLHNFLMKSSSSKNIYNPSGTLDKYDNGVFIEGAWRQEVPQNCAIRCVPHIARRSPISATKIRDNFTEYFVNLRNK
ncbi:unnamed protein product [Acanthoscelides obtectus]|uniref:DDE Tnp4 domain-containing protein n=1 Tax=Acanthoscelides obtectus TaxID=200917 RepID=A0A9P0PQ68_ACAOB|nr:unnamed protein product [Acanthoscelides obtectus]CAK1623189.1 Protein ANTAGONIST OF LIKE HETEROCHROMATIN PROTEIN 1 [Acanthoscelides obtectus]